MKRTLVRYKTRPESAEENQRLIEAVFQELRTSAPAGVRYVALRLGDGTFVHLVETEDEASPIPTLAAFRSFQSGIKGRCAEPPQSADAIVVGNYRMLVER
jgi:radical SAM superfamily enzyme with C-terminal helix-hairpin-helix motif